LKKLRRFLSRALDLYTTLGDLRGAATVLGSIASTHIKQANYDEAWRVLDSAMQTDLDSPRTIIDLMDSTAKLRDHDGDVPSAIRVLSEALGLAVEHTREKSRQICMRNVGSMQNEKSTTNT